jgi:hypothetical protein
MPKLVQIGELVCFPIDPPPPLLLLYLLLYTLTPLTGRREVLSQSLS